MYKGRLSPISVLILFTTSSVADGPAIILATSPGIKYKKAKINIDSPIIIGISENSLLIMYENNFIIP
jgi:hypothetical protein